MKPSTALSFLTVLALDPTSICGAGRDVKPPAAFAPVRYSRVAFPNDPSVIDARREFGLKGDGIADDTQALQNALDASCGLGGKPTRVLFLKNGVYRVTKTLVVKSPLGPWVYGESRDGVVIRLDNGVKGVTAVLRTHPQDSGNTSADWFMRNLRHFTIDVGENPETDGIRYFATNTGILRDVRVVGQGKVGINAGFLGQSGPNLIQDVEVGGFETGILSQWIWGETLSRIRIDNCKKIGVVVNANSVAIEELTVSNTPRALLCDYPNDWTWWGGVVAIVGGRFSGVDPKLSAIHNRSVFYGRDLRSAGGPAVTSDAPGAKAPVGSSVDFYASHVVKRAFDDAPAQSLGLPIKREPATKWETDPKKWVCANEFGAVPGDNRDDTAAIQKAVDEAAARGATVVYLRGIGGPDPNAYGVNGEIRIHGSVARMMGLGFGRVLGGPGGAFVIDDPTPGEVRAGKKFALVVTISNIDAFGGGYVSVVNRSRRTLVVESAGVRIVGEGRGDIFATDCASHIDLRTPGQSLWARQLNPEGRDDLGLVRNAGANLWILGLKCEGSGVRVQTARGGNTEIFGVFLYDTDTFAPTDKRAAFTVDNASLSIAGLREIAFDIPTFPKKVSETQGSSTRAITSAAESGWIGWSLFSSRRPGPEKN